MWRAPNLHTHLYFVVNATLPGRMGVVGFQTQSQNLGPWFHRDFIVDVVMATSNSW